MCGANRSMTNVRIRWRPSGGRGEFEFVPGDLLVDREIIVDFGPLGLRMPSEVIGRKVQGKPRLRKLHGSDRHKLHLPQLVMAVAGLPEPARQDKGSDVLFPLESKKFVMNEMSFSIIDDNGHDIVLAPVRVSVLRSDLVIDLNDRFESIARDWQGLDTIRNHNSELADAITAHKGRIDRKVNSHQIRRTANDMIAIKTDLFGHTNAASATTLIAVATKPEVEAEEISGKEGRLLTRLHVYRERDRIFAKKVRKHHEAATGGRLVCHACSSVPATLYGPRGNFAIEAHHKVPIEQLQPDSITLIRDMAMLCANCHRVVHSQRPCLTVEAVAKMVERHR